MPETREWKSADEILAFIADFPEFGRLDASILEGPPKSPQVNEKGIFGNTPLKIAAVWGDSRAISLLVGAGANVNERNEHGYSALHHAASQGHIDAVKALIDLGADPEQRNDDGAKPIDYAANPQIHEYLSRARA